MTRARSVAANVVALGLAGVVIAPSPAFAVAPFGFVPKSATPIFTTAPAGPTSRTSRTIPAGPISRTAAALPAAPAAPRACERPQRYAAQSSAEFLRIDRLHLPSTDKPTNRSSGTGEAAQQQGGKPDSALGGVGLGDARTVVIADGPVTSAGAARTLDGKVAGSKERGDIAIQKAPPVKPKADTRRTASKKFGPMQVGAGNLSARAVWAHGMACGKAAGDTSSASAEISRVTVAGGGSASLVRVPEKITSRSGTALRLRGGVPQSVGSSTITAGRISLVDNEVRIRMLRAPELRASMTATGQSRVEYRPPVVEVVGRDGKKNRLSTAGDNIAITLSEESRTLESLPSRLDPIGDPPLPQVSGLPVLARTETTPSPDVKPGSTLRIALGEVRQASKNNAVAARATAIRVTLTRNVDNGAASAADRPSGVVADLGIGMLAAAAVAPNGRTSGRSSSAGDKPAQASPAGKGYSSKSGRGATAGWGDAARTGNTSGQTFKPGQGNASGRGSTPGQGNAATTGGGNTSGQTSTSGTANTSSQTSTPGTGDTSGQGFARGDGDVSGTGIGSGDGSSDDQSLSSDVGSGSSQDTALGGVGASGTSRQSGTPGQNGTLGQNGTPGQSLTGPGAGLRGAALPITGPRVVSLLIAGVAMIGVGAVAVYLTSRRRRRS